MVFQTWEEHNEQRPLPEEYKDAIVQVYTVLSERDSLLDIPVLDEQIGNLDKIQRACARSGAMKAQQDIEEVRQKLEDFLDDVMGDTPEPSLMHDRNEDIMGDLRAIVGLD